MLMSRRAAVGSLAALSTAALLGTARLAVAEEDLLGEPQPFRDDHVFELARALAAEPFVDQVVELPPELADLTYDQYRDIRFDPQQSIWRDTGSPFTFDVFHAGFYFKTPVDIHVVETGQARQLRYHPRLFNFGPSVKPPPADAMLPFSGFRVRYPINRPDVSDEFAVFQGASYFRAVARGQVYGLSARGLAIDTAAPTGEEFPVFRAYWLVKPPPGATALTAYALLDSRSVAGAYRFTLRPGEATAVDVELVLFPRRDLAHVGLAPLTSMFLFDATNRMRFDDFRPAVHDSDGLAMLTGRGEWLWRPLANPRTLQVSAFLDRGPRGFGLMQRSRRYEDFHDLEARYERRPSAWVEPLGDWGAGHVELIEIPSEREIHDNIVAYWRPGDVIAAGSEFRLAYRLLWCDGWPPAMPLAKVAETAQGLNWDGNARKFVIEFAGEVVAEDIGAEVTASAGEIRGTVVQPNPHTGGLRLKFELDPQGAEVIELRAMLKRGNDPASETWLYRWTT